MDNKEIISDKPNYLDTIFNELVEAAKFHLLDCHVQRNVYSGISSTLNMIFRMDFSR